MQPFEENIAQDEAEIAAFAELLRRENIKSYLEIGSKFGGSLWRVGSQMPIGSRIVAVDLPRGTKAWDKSCVSLNACIKKLQELGQDARVIWGDSTDINVIEQVRRLGPYDAIFIDANHTLPYVKKDWQAYSPMGRIVAFHDIGWKRAPTWEGTRIDVRQVWDAIKDSFRYQEIKFDASGKNNGIGVLWRD